MREVKNIQEDDVTRVKEVEWATRLGDLMPEQVRCVKLGREKKRDWEEMCASDDWKTQWSDENGYPGITVEYMTSPYN